jgi:hypothetical protein
MAEWIQSPSDYLIASHSFSWNRLTASKPAEWQSVRRRFEKLILYSMDIFLGMLSYRAFS